MSEAYDRIMRARKKDVPNRPTRETKPRNLVSVLDTEQQQENGDNIFLPPKSNVQDSHIKIEKKQTKPKDNKKKSKKLNPIKSQKKEPKIEIEDDQDQMNKKRDSKLVNQFSQIRNSNNSNKKTLLNLRQSLNLLLGHFVNPYTFPIKREIPIIANNDDEAREKYQNGTYISEAFDNNLNISFLLFLFRAVFIQHFFRISHILWLLAIILSFLISTEAQYGAYRYLLLGIYLTYCFFGFIFQFLGIYNRRNWSEQNLSENYQVYQFDNRHGVGEWIPTLPKNLRPGNIFKIYLSSDTVIPTDSIILHSQRSILQVDQSSVLEYLSPIQKQERIVLKQILIKEQEIRLPLTGVIQYQLFAPQVREEFIVGELVLQQPIEDKYPITYNQILLRGTKLLASKNKMNDNEVLCVVLETGIDSLILKSSQFPHQYKISRHAEIISRLLLVCSIAYILLVCVGILIGYIFTSSNTINRGSYIQSYSENWYTSMGIITLHHFTNFIIIIPIFLQVIYLLFSFLQGKIIEKKIGITIRDKQTISSFEDSLVLVTTLVADLPRIDREVNPQKKEYYPKINNNENQSQSQVSMRNKFGRKLHSIKVHEIYHNFNINSIEDQIYSEEDVDLMGYFMAVSLMSCSHSASKNTLTPLQMGIQQKCYDQFGLKSEITSLAKNGLLKIGNFQVYQLLTIMPTNKHPFKITFYQYAKSIIKDVEQDQDQQNSEEAMRIKEQSLRNQKILCLIRGQVTEVIKRYSPRSTQLESYAQKLYQEKGFHVQVLAKSVIIMQKFKIIEKAFLGQFPQDGLKQTIRQFYELLQQNLMQTELLGLLIFDNLYIPELWKPPVSSLPSPPFKIIIAPQSRFEIAPQFHSIHTITNYLLKTFNLPVSQLSGKIIHQYTTIDEFVNKLQKEKVLVLNGWEGLALRKMLEQLKQSLIQGEWLETHHKKSHKNKILGYTEHDEYAWVLKYTDLSITYADDGFDLNKYPDIVINSSKSVDINKVLRKLFLYSKQVKRNLNAIIMIQFRKSFILLTIQFIGCFYTWGTGIAIIKTQLFLLLEIVLLFDLMYYLIFALRKYDINQWNREQQKQRKIRKKKNNQQFNISQKQTPINIVQLTTPSQIIIHIIIAVVLGCFITFISIYSLTQPLFSAGTVEPSSKFTPLVIHFVLTHTLIFTKLVTPQYRISIYKILIVILQLVIYYVGIIIISEFDTYNLKGVIWYMFSGRIIVLCIFLVWMAVGFNWFWFVMNAIRRQYGVIERKGANRYSKLEEERNYQQKKKSSRDITMKQIEGLPSNNIMIE